MDDIFQVDVPSLTMPETMMFAYPTRLLHCFKPQAERIYLPPLEWPQKKVEIRVKTGNTGPRKNGTRKWKIYQKAKTALTGGVKTLDYSGKFVFDVRLEVDVNPAHIIESILTTALLAREVLSKHLGKDVEINIVLRKNSPELARESCHLLNFPTINTDDDVKGEIVTVSDYIIPSLRPRLFDVDFPGSNEMHEEKIFISRRGSRRLINNEEVCAFLSDRGFKTFYFEDLSVSQKWSLARNAKFIVAVSGAAGANVLFNRLGLQPGSQLGSGVKMLEFLHPAWSHIGYRDNVKAINGRWCAVRGQATPEILQAVDFSGRLPHPVRRPHCNPFMVDIDTITMGLDYLESGTFSSDPIVEQSEVAAPGMRG